MAIQSLLNFVNGIGSTFSSCFTTFVTINYFVGQTIFSLLTATFYQLKSLTILAATATYVFLEDLATFALETCESILAGFEFMTGAIDALISGISCAVAAVKSAIVGCITNVCQLAGAVCDAVTGAVNSVQEFFHLIGASLLLLAGLVPKTIKFFYSEITSLVNLTLQTVSSSVLNVVNSIKAAPIESFIGLIATGIISFSTFKLARQFVVNHNVTWTTLGQVSFRLFCFVYLHICLVLIGLGRGIARTVEFTLTHLHVPRFHHAGEVSDDEDDDANGNENAEDEPETAAIRRRNYDLLLKRRNERKNLAAADGRNIMEDLLFEQVEREREDKLCVVCQDKEKCIMILPCRHLCICQDCLPPLLRSRNGVPICPMCRKLIRQTIKVYL